NPPTFDGITSATAVSSSSVTVKWPAPSALGVTAATYQIFVTPGTNVDWTQSPMRTISSSGTFQTTLTGLGHEMPYAFGVRACSTSGLCDTNTVVKTLTTADGGIPKTTGISSAIMKNGAVKLTMPWNHTLGGLAKRRIYRTTTAGITPIAANLI